MPSLHRFVIIVSAVTVVGALKALVPDYTISASPMQRSVNNESVPHQAHQVTTQQNVGLNVLRTENSTHIQQQINIENAKLMLSSDADSPHVNPYEDAHTGQLYFLPHIAANGVSLHSETQEPQRRFQLSDNLNMDVEIAVTGMIARATVKQTFTNTSDNWVDGLYVFPLPEDAAVDHLLIEIDDRKIEGQIKEKEVAKKIFEQAKQAGKKASLVEQRRPNLFTNNIANIGPNETIVITIEYQQVLSFEQGGYALRFPLGITSRYAPGDATREERETARISEHISPHVQTVNLTVKLDTGLQLNNIESEHHLISTQPEQDNKYVVTLDEHPVKMQDFVLRWQPELGSAPTSAHFTQFVNGSEYGLIMLYPPLPDEQNILDREVIFVIDTSGSMSGEAIIQAKQALAYAVDDLSTRDKFNIIEFSSSAEVLWRKAKFADADNKADAFDFISGLTANGGTEMRQALSMALLSEADPELFKQILFITDGSVSNESALMTLIEDNLHEARLFTIGIGAAPNSHFMTEAAKSGKGTFTYIGDTSLVQRKMAKLLTKINTPALTNIQLTLNNTQQEQKFEMYPNVIADLYASEPLIITYKKALKQTENDAKSMQEEPMLVGTFNDSPWYFSAISDSLTTNNQVATPVLDVTQIAKQQKAKGINVLWARKKIAQLTRDKRKLASLARGKTNVQGEQEAQQIVQEITSTALEHHIVSQYTSLVAVDLLPTIERVKTNHLTLTKHGASLPQTATKAHLNMIIGVFLLMFSLLLSKFLGCFWGTKTRNLGHK